ncbi:MAG: hydrogenase iron-sulfur subunit [Candidatus Helarchaeota archaeon]
MSNEINILALICNECTYAAADLAGMSRFEYPTNIKIVRVPCTGRVDLPLILEAFVSGADGVIISGCLKDQCHYETGNNSGGNYRAEQLVKFVQDIFKEIGISPARIEMHFISASMAREWVKVASEFTKKIYQLGKLEKKIRERIPENPEV